VLTPGPWELAAQKLKARPFECQVVAAFHFAQSTPVCLGGAAVKLWELFRDNILSLRREDSYGVLLWSGANQTPHGPQNQELSSYFYGACRVGDLVVVVGKNPGDLTEPAPIDGLFLDAVKGRVADVLGTSPMVGTSPPDGVAGIAAELRALQESEGDWRQHYGDDVWLAVRDGTVPVCAKTLDELEERVVRKGLPSPMLFVPPAEDDAE